jgi:hypothetical protein
MDDITGRDSYILAKALAYAVACIDSLPREKQEVSDRDDMAVLFNACPEWERGCALQDVERHTGRMPDMIDRKRTAIRA